MAASPKEVIQRLYKEFWNQRKLEVADQLVAPSHALTSPHISGANVGPGAYKRQIALFLTGFPDLQFIVEDTVCEKDKVVASWTLTGTHKGDFLGIAATNKTVSIPGITIHQVVDGKILESQATWDAISLFQQLGIALPIKLDKLPGPTP
jgi:steroid delta-isomerase-like uncharacterized protein